MAGLGASNPRRMTAIKKSSALSRGSNPLRGGTMAEILTQLIKLQELEFARSEQRAIEDEIGATAVASEIQELQAQLPLFPSALFRRLRTRYLAVVVPLHHGACSGCGVAAPTSQAQAVRANRELQQCRNCQRILYHPEHVPQQHRGPTKLTSTSAGPLRFSLPALMVPGLEADSREAVLFGIVDAMAAEGVMEDSQRLLALALDREELASTALESGLAFPHVRGIEGGGMVFGLGVSAQGLHFDPRSSRRTFIIVFTIIPAAASSLYLRLVADLLQALRHRSAQRQLQACTTKAALWRALSGLTSGGSATPGRKVSPS